MDSLHRRVLVRHGVRRWAIQVAPDGRSMSYAARFDFPTANNASEYETLLLGLRKAKALGAKCMVVKSDSRLMAGHFDKTFATRDPEMARYLAAMRTAANDFLGLTVQAIPRGANEAADRLAKMASSGDGPPPEVFYEVLRAPSVAPGARGAEPETSRFASQARWAVHLVMLIDEADWRDKITSYLTGEEPEDSAEAKRLRHRAKNYHIIGGELYKGGVCTPFFRCISRQEGQDLLREIHEGACGAHQAPRGLVARAFRQGLYWPTALQDAQDLVQHCQGC